MSDMAESITPPALVYRPWALQRALQTIPASALGSKLFAQWLHHLDRWTLTASSGRLTFPGMMTGLPVVVLTSMGAKSGQPRTTPLVAVPDGARILLVASNWGQAKSPAWSFNVRAHPQVTLSFQGYSGPYLAQEVQDPNEYERCWQQAVAVYRGYAAYRQRAGSRHIPLFALTPASEGIN